jgi:hypothetical protein
VAGRGVNAAFTLDLLSGDVPHQLVAETAVRNLYHFTIKKERLKMTFADLVEIALGFLKESN